MKGLRLLFFFFNFSCKYKLILTKVGKILTKLLFRHTGKYWKSYIPPPSPSQMNIKVGPKYRFYYKSIQNSRVIYRPPSSVLPLHLSLSLTWYLSPFLSLANWSPRMQRVVGPTSESDWGSSRNIPRIYVLNGHYLKE